MHLTTSFFKRLFFRNKYNRNGRKAQKNIVNLEYFNSEVNLGDALAPVIYKWMLDRKAIDVNKQTKGTKHLMTVGSILGGSGFFDATVWGSGIKSFDQVSSIGKRRYFQKLDIRAVRGPLTKDALFGCGHKCPDVFGDPAILMPLIYTPKSDKRDGVGIVLHFHQSMDIPEGFKNINIRTSDYKKFIDEICCCDKIISSSLHGVILAEAYGIPAVFLCEGRSYEIIKYYDWYFSTGRKNVVMASTLNEAIEMKPMELPDLSKMQENLIDAFPYDLWGY